MSDIRAINEWRRQHDRNPATSQDADRLQSPRFLLVPAKRFEDPQLVMSFERQAVPSKDAHSAAFQTRFSGQPPVPLHA